ncbi:response regulator [candidate division KSB1 bacterium]|nr:response regulator [candidate division KSB1 bacterium]NIR72773.1 response regulator [candidate division KSB1 bacterium]NIS23729.1 response regulator [candidate division KSB1 bacterium]NIT70649.1 response regulator [candidate division KSB1 bacterium]NIU24377.1 response regulator [candidate division KSB1 bacterium]
MTDRILIVDSEESLRRRYEVELEEEGYDVVTAAGGHDALSKINDQLVDLVIVELQLSDGSGLEYLQQILDLKRDLKVVINTDDPTYKMDFHSWAADAFVLKSGDLAELKETIDALLHRKKLNR